MALPFIFANVTELDTPNLDSNFNALGALTVIPCVAVGTNAITLTPLANTPAIAAYSNNAPVFGFQAAATTTTTPVTLQVGGLAALNVYKANGSVAIGANDFLIGNTYYVAYNGALNGNAGGWVLVNPGASAATAGAVQSAFKNLIVTNTTAGTPNTQCIITADSVAVSDGTTNFTTLLSVNVTISSAASGANGLDTGSLAASTWYAIYVIYNPSTLSVAGLMSTSSTSPTLPSGYTQYSRLGWMRADGSKNFLRILQKGRRAQYVATASTNTTNPPNVATSTQGSGTGASPTTVSVSLANFVPVTASEVLALTSNTWQGNSAEFYLHTSTQMNGSQNGPDGTNGFVWPIGYQAGSTFRMVMNAWLLLEAQSLAILSSSTGGALSVMGWTDNI